MKQRTKQSENDVEVEIISYLRAQGWICRRQHVILPAYNKAGVCVGNVGEEGECDWRCMKRAGIGGTLDTQYLEVEVKRPNKKPKKKQPEYLAKRKAQGFIAVWADSLEMFRKKTGL